MMGILLSGCDEETFRTKCPSLVKYSPAFLQEAYKQYDSLPKGSPLRVMITDYSKTRDACRALEK